jgi:AraC-like DNA-binding protein
VWIEQNGRPPFVADPHVMVLYNLGQPYTRRPLAPDGDRADWFSVGPDLAASIAKDVQPDGDPRHPFPIAYVSAPSALFYRQRRTLARILRGEADAFFVEQEVVGVVGTAMERAAPRTGRARQDIRAVVEATRAEICRDPSRAFTVRELASRVAVSPFHLCRIFRRETGVTLHEYLVDLRLRLSLEHLSGRQPDLSRVALEVGFSSHSHFSAAFRRRLGVSPSRARKELSGIGATLSNRVTAAGAA